MWQKGNQAEGQGSTVLLLTLPPNNHVALESPLFLFGTQFPLMLMHRIGLVGLYDSLQFYLLWVYEILKGWPQSCKLKHLLRVIQMLLKHRFSLVLCLSRHPPLFIHLERTICFPDVLNEMEWTSYHHWKALTFKLWKHLIVPRESSSEWGWWKQGGRRCLVNCSSVEIKAQGRNIEELCSFWADFLCSLPFLWKRLWHPNLN